MPATLFAEDVRAPLAACTAERGGRRGLTLEQLLSGAWEGLAAHGSVTCPACAAAEMQARYAAGPTGAPVGGRCGGCGSTLA